MGTVSETQTELGVEGASPRILRTEEGATIRQNYVLGGAAKPGKARWVPTTISDSGADQAAAILTGLA